MATQDEMLRALVGLDDNSSNYTLADAVGNTDTTTARARSLIGLDDNPNNYTLADVLGYAAPSIPPPQPTGPTQQKRLEPPQEKRLEPPPEIYQVPTPTPVDDTGRVNPNKVAAPSYITGLAGVDRPYDPSTGYMYQTGIGGERMKGWGGGDLSVRDGAIFEGDVAPSYMKLLDGQMVSTGQTLDQFLASLVPAAAQPTITGDTPAAINTNAAPAATNAVFNAADSSSFGPTLDTAYKPGQTLQDYLAAQKAAFVPQYIGAVEDTVIGSGDSGQFIPGTAAHYSAFGDMQGDIEKATNDYYKALYANDPTVTSIGQGWGLQDWVPSAAENNVDPNYAGWARLIGFQGPTVREAGYTYHPPEDYGAGESTSAGTTAGFYAPKTEATPEFKQALAGYGFRQTQDSKGNGIVEMVDPNMNVVGRQRVYSGEGSASQLIKASMMALAAYALGPAFGELLGAAGAGTLGSAAAGADLGLLGINTGLAAGTTGGAALGTAASLGGNALANTLLNTVVNGKDLDDALLDAVKTAGTSFAGSQLAGFAPTDLTGTGSTLLNQTATDLLKGAASGAVGAAASGNSIWEAALAGAASGGINSTVGSSLQGMGFKPAEATAAIKIFNGIKNENFADILNGANQFVNSPDVALAGKAATLVRAIESKNPTAIFNAGKDFSSGLTSDAAAKIAAATTAGGKVLDTSSLEGAGLVGIETLFDPTRVVKKTTGDSADYGAATGIGAPGTSYTVSPGTVIPKTAGELAALANPDALGILSGAGAAGSSYSVGVVKGPAGIPDTSPATEAVLSEFTNVQPTTFGQIEAAKIIAANYPGKDLSWVDRGVLNAAASHVMAGDEAGLVARLKNGQALGVVPNDSWTDPSLSKYVPPEGYRVAKDGEPASVKGYTDAGGAVYLVPSIEVSGGKKYANMTPEEQAAYNKAHPIAPDESMGIDENGVPYKKNALVAAAENLNDIVAGFGAAASKGIGEQINLAGTVASWLGASKDNPVSKFGSQLELWGKQMTPERVIDQQKNIQTAIANESTFPGKAFAAVAAAVTNPLGFVDWVGGEALQEMLPMAAALKAGKLTTAAAAAFGEAVAAKLGLGAAIATDSMLNAGESGASSYNTVYAARIKAGDSTDDAESAANKAAVSSALITLVTSAAGDSALMNRMINDVKGNVSKAATREAVSETVESGAQADVEKRLSENGKLTYGNLAKNAGFRANEAVLGGLIGAKTSGIVSNFEGSSGDTASTYTAPSGATTNLLTGAPATATPATTAPATTTAGTPATQTVLTGQGGETLSAGDLGVDTTAATVTENAPDAANIIQQYVDLGLAGGQTGDAAAELATLTGTGDVAAKAGDSSAVIGTDANGQAVTIADIQALTGNTGAVTTAGPGATTTVTPGANTVVATDANGQVVTLADIQALTGNTGATTTPGVTTGAAVDTGAAVNTGTAVDTGAAAATDTTPGVITGAAVDTTPGVTTGAAIATDTTPGVTTGTAIATDTTPGVTTGAAVNTGAAVDTGAAVNTGAAVDTGAAVNTAVNSSTVINTATNGNTATNAVVATDPNVVTTTDSNGATVNSNTATGVTTVINNNANTIVTTDPNAQTVTATDATSNVTIVTNTATGVTVVVDPTVTTGVVTDPTVTTGVVTDPTITTGVVTDPTVTPDVVVEPPPPPVVVEPPRPPPPPPKPPTPPPKPPTPPRPTAAPSPSSPAGALSQELMKLSDFDLEALFSPSLKEYRKEQRGKRNKPTEEDQMMDLLRELGYRS